MNFLQPLCKPAGSCFRNQIKHNNNSSNLNHLNSMRFKVLCRITNGITKIRQLRTKEEVEIVYQIWKKTIFSNQEAEWSRLQVMAMPVVWVSTVEPHQDHKQETRTRHQKNLQFKTKDKPISILSSQYRITEQGQALLVLLQDQKSINFRVDKRQWATWRPKLKSICMDSLLILNPCHKWEQLRRNHS